MVKVSSKVFDILGGKAGMASKVTRASSSASVFDDLYNIVKLNNGRIKLVPKYAQHNGRTFGQYELPDYLYHITSESNCKLMQKSGKIKISANEQLRGVYLFDKENFLSKYTEVGTKRRDLCKALLNHNGSQKLVVLRIPTASLVRHGKFRLRTQEDFFYFADKIFELQKGLNRKFSLRMLANDNNRAKFIKYVLDNKLITKSELDQLMKQMEQKIHRGYPLDQFTQLEKNNAIEFIFNKDIPLNISQKKKFLLSECVDSKTGKVNIKQLRNILN